MKRYQLLICVFLLFSFCSFSQYKWVNPLPQGNTLHSVYFVDENIGYTIGDGGAALKTTDGGATWNVLNTNTGRNLNDVFFIDSNYGFAVGNSGTILKTTDQGNTWAFQSTGSTSHLYSVFFTDSQTGYSCGQNGIILKTIDAGLNWDSCASNITTDLYSMDFITGNIGYICGRSGGKHLRGIVIKTIDAGNTWSTLSDSLDHLLLTLDFTDSLTGFAAGLANYIIKTEDGGLNWTVLNEPTSNSGNLSIDFISSQIGYACDDYGNLLKTENGGQSWSKIDSPVYKPLYSITFFGDNSVCSVGAGGRMLISNDDGDSYTNSQSGTTSHLNTIQKSNNDHIFVVGDNTLFKSTDNGLIWNKFEIPESDRCRSASFVNYLTGYVLTDMGIFKTDDSGLTWTKCEQYPMYDLRHITMTSESVGYAVGGYTSAGGMPYPSLYKTTDGNLWIRQDAPFNVVLFKSYFFDDTHGYLLGNSGCLYYTSDGGAGWKLINLNVPHTLIDMKFINENTGYILAEGYYDGNIIFKTSDGGSDWNIVYQESYTGERHNFKSIDFHGDKFVEAVGENGYILKSYDEGNTWQTEKCFTANTLTDILLINDSTGFIVGDYGTFLNFGTIPEPEIVVSIDNCLNIYPNPFTDKLLIEVPSNIDDEISIELYDMQSRLVMKVRESIKQDNRIIILYPDPFLEPGIYIYELKGTELYKTGKVIKN